MCSRIITSDRASPDGTRIQSYVHAYIRTYIRASDEAFSIIRSLPLTGSQTRFSARARVHPVNRHRKKYTCKGRHICKWVCGMINLDSLHWDIYTTLYKSSFFLFRWFFYLIVWNSLNSHGGWKTHKHMNENLFTCSWDINFIARTHHLKEQIMEGTDTFHCGGGEIKFNQIHCNGVTSEIVKWRPGIGVHW